MARPYVNNIINKIKFLVLNVFQLVPPYWCVECHSQKKSLYQLFIVFHIIILCSEGLQELSSQDNRESSKHVHQVQQPF